MFNKKKYGQSSFDNYSNHKELFELFQYIEEKKLFIYNTIFVYQVVDSKLYCLSFTRPCTQSLAHSITSSLSHLLTQSHAHLFFNFG